MRVRWSETALAEIEGIFSYIHERNPSAARAVVERIDGLTALLDEFPLVGHVTDEPNVRMLSVVRYPFLIFYAIDNEANDPARAACRATTSITFAIIAGSCS